MTLDVNLFNGLIDYDAKLNAAIIELHSMFPKVGNVSAWKEAVFSAQLEYRDEAPELADRQLYVAMRWIELAASGRLTANMDQYRGLIVAEKVDIEATQRAPSSDLIRTFLEKLLFKLLCNRSNERNLQLFEVQAAFQTAVNRSLGDYKEEFNSVMTKLEEKYYVTSKKVGNSGKRIFFKGIAFDDWEAEMTAKEPTTQEPTSNTYHFHGTVGAVQTGAKSVAHVQQAADQSQLAELKSALEAVLAGLAKADLAADERENVEGLVQNTIAEVEKDKPNTYSLKAMLGGVATTIQTLGSTAEAYKTLKAAALVIGITLP